MGLRPIEVLQSFKAVVDMTRTASLVVLSLYSERPTWAGEFE